ncbi:MAG: ABC transporter ATP-binding protein [Oligoflexia bacterium]|nr:ABC transporter ATP-binding protein [Oligoflexia bacterium]
MIFSVEALSFRYRRHEPWVVRDFSLGLSPGDFVALLGPNGGGKSTLLKLLAGIIPGAEGVVRYQDRNFLALSPAERALKVAYSPAVFHVEFPMTAEQAVMMGRTASGGGFLRHINESDRASVGEAMELCCCSRLRERDVRELSGGERQLVQLARSIATGAKILFLDEGLSQMDLNHQSAIGKMLRGLATDRGYAIILVAHDVNLAVEWASHCLLMKGGRKIAYGPVEKALTQEHLRELYPDTSFIVGTSPATGSPKVFFSK